MKKWRIRRRIRRRRTEINDDWQEWITKKTYEREENDGEWIKDGISGKDDKNRRGIE